MRIFYRFLRFLSAITLFFFCWTYLSVWEVAAFAMEKSNAGVPTKAATEVGKAAESSNDRFAAALYAVRENILKAEERAALAQDYSAKIEAVRTKKAEIDNLAVELRKEFEATEQKIKGSNLPREILDRHAAFVKHTNENLAELNSCLDAIESAENSAQLKAVLEKARLHLERAHSQKKQAAVDLTKLSNRQVKAKEREPRLNKEDFEKEFGPGTGGNVYPAAQSSSKTIFGTEDRGLESWIRKRASARKQIQLAYNGPAGDMFPDFGLELSVNNDDLKVLRGLSLISSGIGDEKKDILLAQTAVNLPNDADLAETPEVQFSPEIRAKALELGYNPVKIYEWVRNNIEYVSTYGSIQGADMCLQTKQCNDVDTASLLIALFRVSGIHARYAFGTIEVPIDKVMSWAGGLSDPMSTAEFLSSAGIPVKLIYSGGKIQKLRLEHAWVDAWIDYIPTRGARHTSGQGDTWIPVDASFKQHRTTGGLDFAAATPFDTQAFVNQLVGSSTISEPENYATNVQCASVSQFQESFRSSVQNHLATAHSDASLSDVLGSTAVIEEDLPYLLGTLPYQTVVKGGQYTQVPSSLRHSVTFELVNNDTNSANYSETSLSLNMSLAKLAGRRVTLSYTPATANDEAVINSYAPQPHADGTPISLSEYPSSLPAYLVQVKAELRVDGVVVATGLEVGAGGYEKFTIRTYSPNLSEGDQELAIKAGEYAGIAFGAGPVTREHLDGAKATLEESATQLQAGNLSGLTKDDVLGKFLHASALANLAEVDAISNVRARLMGVAGVRMPSSSVVMLMISTSYFYGIPRSISVAGPSNPVTGYRMVVAAKDGDRDKARKYLMVAGLDASAMASSLQEYLLSTTEYPVTSVSAVKAMKTASELAVPLYRIIPSNSASIIGKLQLADVVKQAISNEAAAGLTHITPQKNVTLGGWSGVGYEVVDSPSGNNYANLNGPANVVQGLPWPGRSILLTLLPAKSEPPATLSSSVITDTFIGGIGGAATGLAGLSYRPATDSADLLTTSLLYDRLGSQLGCYVDLGSPSVSTGACMASYLSLLCTAMSTPVIADKNTRPVADAGADRSIGLGETVILDGSRSFDADNDPLVYLWRLASVPQGSSATLADAASMTTSLTPDVAGVYTVELIVKDGKVSSAADTVTITAISSIVNVPSLTGLSLQQAENIIQNSGLGLGSITAASDGTVEAGRVASQNPAAGTSIDRGSSVSLVVSTGSQADTEPPVVTVSFDRSPALYTAGAAVRLTINVSDTVGVSSVSLTVDGSAVNATLPVTTIDTTGYAAGSTHTVLVTAQDISQNTGTTTATFGILDPNDTAAPKVSIASPAPDAAITAPTDITGSVSDSNLFEYTLAYAPAGKTSYTVFARGNQPVASGVLGRLDPSLMQNGIYDVILTAVDANGNTATYPTRYRVTGDLKVGNFTVSFTDLSVPVAGIPVTVTRTYDSRDKNSRDFGFGWTIDIQSVKIEENSDPGLGWNETSSGGWFPTYCVGNEGERYVAITLPDGRVEEFDMTVTPKCQQYVPIEYPTISYTARPGTTSTLQAVNAGMIYYNSGVLLDLDTVEPYNPSEYLLTTADGMVYDLDQSFGVKTVKDTNGNVVTYGTSGITHSSGKSVSFSRDSKGRITKVTDPAGKVIAYSYDANGNLASVTDQAGNVTTYTYNSTHGLVDMIDPLGRRAVRNEYDSSGRLVAHIDAEGKRIEYTHDIAGRQEVVKDRNGNLTVYIYDSNGRVLKKTDPEGNVTRFTYDTVGNKTSETDPLGKITRWTYDSKKNVLTEAKVISGQTLTTSHTYNSLGKLLTTRDPLGHVTTNTYDAKGNILTTTDALGNTTTNNYDSKGNLASTTDALGNTTRYEYDGYGNRTKQTSALGAITTYTYDSNGNKLTETDPRGNTATYTYDANGKLLTVTSGPGIVTKYEYDKAGNKVAETNPLGLVTSYLYDSANRLIETQYPDGTSTKIGYDAEGNRITSTDQLGRVTTNTYNANKQLIKTTYADNTTRSFGYDPAGRQTTVTDALGNITTKVYDALGRMASSIDPEGNTTSFEYDVNGNQVKRIDANNHATTFTYDANNRLITTTLPGGQATTIGYDALGRKVSESDAAGNATQFEYDAQGNLIKVTDAEGGITKYEYDLNNNRTAIVDAKNNRTTFVFDNVNRLISKTMPNGGIETYAYDQAGRQIAKTDAKGLKIKYSYDSNGRLITRSYPDNSTVRFTYTDTGKRATAVDKRGTTSYAYDTRDRLANLTYPDGKSINYGYDLAGRIASLLSSLTGTISYIYTNGTRLREVRDPLGNVTAYAYDAAGNRTGLNYPNGTAVSYKYDTNNRLLNLTHTNAFSGVIASYAYTLGAIGNRTRIDESTGISRQYQYDKLYRLTTEKVADPLNAQTYQNDFSYDAVGNRLNKTNTTFNQSAVSNDYSYNAADQLITENGITYAYDLNGNLSAKTDSTGTTTYSYDYENRLADVTTPVGIVTYQYDADGNRVTASSASGTAKYLVDTNRSLPQVLAEYTPAGTLRTSYVYADDLISMNRGGVVSYYHFDGLGSTRLLTNAAGSVSDIYDYDAFGNQIARTGTTVNEFLFTGQQYDANVGFYYLRARYYQPDTGRFTVYDPYQGDPYTPLSLHRYLYAADDPVSKIDPTGMFTMGEAMCVVNIIVSIASIVYGSYKMYSGDYIGGTTDIVLGFMGVGFFGSSLKFLRYAGSAAAAAVRLKYLRMVEILGEEVVTLSNSGKTVAEIAEWVVEARNAVKLEARAMMIASEGNFGRIMVKALEFRNWLKYGNGVGPTVEWLLKSGKTYEQIIKSALKTSEKVNSFLGVL